MRRASPADAERLRQAFMRLRDPERATWSALDAYARRRSISGLLARRFRRLAERSSTKTVAAENARSGRGDAAFMLRKRPAGVWPPASVGGRSVA